MTDSPQASRAGATPGRDVGAVCGEAVHVVVAVAVGDKELAGPRVHGDVGGPM
jgi:hypothetical protein